jgi:hypothetical protein
LFTFIASAGIDALIVVVVPVDDEALVLAENEV